MRKNKWLIAALVAMTIGCAVGATACVGEKPDDSGTGQQQIQPSIELSVETMSITQFDTATLTYTLTGMAASTAVAWESSDPSIAAVDSDGKLTAYKVGTVTVTATAGEYSDTVLVTVTASTDFPSLSLSQVDAKLKIGGSVTVYPTVMFRGDEVDDQPVITWSTTSEAISLTNKEDGSVTISGLSVVENAIVSARTTYLGKELVQVVTVTVTEDIEFAIDKNEAQLYTYTYGTDYSETLTLNSTVTLNGAVDEDAVVAWSSDTESVATVENGVVTAVSAGETTITATYEAANGTTYTRECIVTVSVPSIDTGRNTKIYLDESDGDQVIDIATEYGISDTSVSYNLIDVATDSEIACTVVGTSYTFNITDKTYVGERAVKFVAEGRVELNATLTVVTKKISTAEELINLRNYGVVTDAETIKASASWDKDRTKDKFYGYFVLTADIDLSDAGTIGINYARGDLGEYGMIGGLDGQGHTIYGGTFYSGGLFGGLNKNSVVRNVAFMNVTLTSALYGTLGTSACGLIENVLIEVTKTMGTNQPNSGGIAEFLCGTVRNTVIYHPVVPNNVTSGSICVNMTGDGRIENVYVFGDGKTVNYNAVGTDKIVDLNVYAENESLANVTFTGLVGDYWNFTGEKVFFNGLDQLVKASVAEVEVKSLKEGDAVDLPSLPSGLTYTLNVAEDYASFVTLDGTTLTVANEISGAFSFGITVSEWNGIDFDFAWNIDVLDITNIVLEETQKYVLYTYSETEKRVANTTAFTADLSTKLDSDIPSGLTWKLYNGATDVATVSDYLTVSGKTLSIPANVLVSAKLYGEFTLQGESTDGNYIIMMPVALITMEISNASKEVLADFLSYADVADTTYSAYFVLTENIDASDMTINTSGTFNGIFDGRGYAIDGMTTGKGGLFNAIGINSVVKNLAVTNTKIVAGAWDSPSVMTGSAWLYGKIEDCYIEIVSVTNTSGEAYPFDGNGNRYAMGVCGSMDDGEINNVIVKIASGVVMSHNICNMLLNRQDDSVCTITNTYVIGGVTLNTGWNEGGASVSVANVTGLTAEQQATFNSDIWTFDEEGNPSFKKASA